jgi:VRR-NUC domain
MPSYDERWLAEVLARGHVRLAGPGVPGERALHGSDTPAIARPHLSEAVFQRAVMELAKACGYSFCYHTYRSTKSMGGFPDLVLAHREPGHVCYAVELKTDTGQCTKAQEAWLAALAGSTGVVAATWRPSQWEEIIAQLRGER